MLHSLLSGRRTALVMPWAKDRRTPIVLLAAADDKSGTVARLQPGVHRQREILHGAWCRVSSCSTAPATSTAIRQDKLWGVYPDEKVGLASQPRAGEV